MRRRRSPEVFRITGARQGLAEDVRGRQRRYVISMLIRTVAVILTVLLWNVQRPLAIGMLVLGAALPYIAVVAANAGRENAQTIPSTFVRTLTQPMLGGRVSSAPEDQQTPDGPNGAESPESPEATQATQATQETAAENGAEAFRAEQGRTAQDRR